MTDQVAENRRCDRLRLVQPLYVIENVSWLGTRVEVYKVLDDLSEYSMLATVWNLVAKTCNLDRTYISDIERGERNISLLNLKKLADALRIPFSTIVC